MISELKDGPEIQCDTKDASLRDQNWILWATVSSGFVCHKMIHGTCQG